MTAPRAIVTVWAAALVALCLFLGPGDFKGLAVLPAFAWLVCWVHLGPHRARGAHELDDWPELDDQADELDDWPERIAREGVPVDVLGFTDDGQVMVKGPSKADDPVGYYSMLAARYVRPGWQQQAADDGPHLLTAPGPAGVLQPMPGPVPMTGGPVPAVGTGEAGPPADYPPELDHTRVIDVQSAELATWPAAEDLAAGMAADAALDRVRTAFDFIRRTVL
jgi:hypothetical protein